MRPAIIIVVVQTGSCHVRIHASQAVGLRQLAPVTFGEEMQAFMVFCCIQESVSWLLSGSSPLRWGKTYRIANFSLGGLDLGRGMGHSHTIATPLNAQALAPSRSSSSRTRASATLLVLWLRARPPEDLGAIADRRVRSLVSPWPV